MAGRGIKRGMEFVPHEYRPAFYGVSKAHLADLVWSLAGRCAESADLVDGVFDKACEESDRVSIERHEPSLRTIHDRREASIMRQEDRMVGPNE